MTCCSICGARSFNKIFSKGGYEYYKCQKCGVIKILPIPSAQELRTFYELDYIKETGGGNALSKQGKMAHATSIQRLQKINKWTKGKKWLDIGCSTGAFLSVASENNIDIEGIDISCAAIKQAQDKGLKATAITLEEYKPNYVFDAITGFDVIEHVPDPLRFLELSYEILKPSGILVLTTPNTSDFFCRLMGKQWHYFIPVVHLTHLNPNNIRILLNKAGFEVMEISKAKKNANLEYATEAFSHSNKYMYYFTKTLSYLAPNSIKKYNLSISTGEMFVIARRTAKV